MALTKTLLILLSGFWITISIQSCWNDDFAPCDSSPSEVFFDKNYYYPMAQDSFLNFELLNSQYVLDTLRFHKTQDEFFFLEIQEDCRQFIETQHLIYESETGDFVMEHFLFGDRKHSFGLTENGKQVMDIERIDFYSKNVWREKEFIEFSLETGIVSCWKGRFKLRKI